MDGFFVSFGIIIGCWILREGMNNVSSSLRRILYKLQGDEE